MLLFVPACVQPLSPPAPQAPSAVVSPASSRRSKESPPQIVMPGISYASIAEVLRRPALFAGQTVRLKGRVTEVQEATSPSGRVSTSFSLADSAGHTLKVVTEERTAVRKGLEVTVEGKLTAPPSSASSSSLIEIQAARVAVASSSGKNSAGTASAPQSKPPSLPSPSSEPPVLSPAQEKEAGRIF